MGWVKTKSVLVIGGLLAIALLGFGWLLLLDQPANEQTDRNAVGGKQGGLDAPGEPGPNSQRDQHCARQAGGPNGALLSSRLNSSSRQFPLSRSPAEASRSLLDQTVFDLHRKAEAASVALPSKDYAFTFAHQKTQLSFRPKHFRPLPQQLAEIRAISEILFDAEVNRLITIRRGACMSTNRSARWTITNCNPR